MKVINQRFCTIIRWVKPDDHMICCSTPQTIIDFRRLISYAYSNIVIDPGEYVRHKRESVVCHVILSAIANTMCGRG